MPDIETGSRPSINQQSESHSRETDVAIFETLRTNGDESLVDLVETFSPDTIDKLEKALNENGSDWRFLALTSKDNPPAMVTKLTKWKEDIESAADAAAIRNTNRAFVESLEDTSYR